MDYSTDSELDYAEAQQLGEFYPERAYVLTDRDVWHKNPYYKGPPVPHPEDDAACEEYARTGVYVEPERLPPTVPTDWDDMPF